MPTGGSTGWSCRRSRRSWAIGPRTQRSSKSAPRSSWWALANILLNDPGPLHLDDDALALHLDRMMVRYLGLPEAVAPVASATPRRSKR
jgi:hypothetical protein